MNPIDMNPNKRQTHIIRHLRRRATPLMVALVGLFVALGALAQESPRPPTTPTSIGLFYIPGAPERISLWREGDQGQRLFLRGRVLSPDGEPLDQALVELWHADALGGVDESRYRTSQRTEADGSFGVKTVLPGHIEMARDNLIFAPRHIHIVVSHPNYDRLVSMIFFKGDERLTGSPYPDLAIHLEESKTEGETLLFGLVELVLSERRTGNTINNDIKLE